MRSWRQLSSPSFHQTTTWPPGRYKMLTATLLKDNGCETSGMRWPTVIQQWLFQMVHLSSLADECIKDHKSMSLYSFYQFLASQSWFNLVILCIAKQLRVSTSVTFCGLQSRGQSYSNSNVSSQTGLSVAFLGCKHPPKNSVCSYACFECRNLVWTLDPLNVDFFHIWPTSTRNPGKWDWSCSDRKTHFFA